MTEQKLNKRMLMLKRVLLITLISCAFVISLRAQLPDTAVSTGFLLVQEQETAPGMVLIEGQSFYISGQNRTVRKTQASFYIAVHEETNGQYLAYLNCLKKYYSKASYENALPDTLVWYKESLEDSVKKYLAKNYLRGACFANFPVVGVSPAQIEKYAKWKTDRLNEMILIREGLIDYYSPLDSSAVFTGEAYMQGTWKGGFKQKVSAFDSLYRDGFLKMEEGIFSPNYRLATADEWKWANYAMGFWQGKKCVTPKEIRDKKLDKKHYFDFLYVKPSKDINCHKGVLASQKLSFLKEVYSTAPNLYKIRGMDENVSEWVVDNNQTNIVLGRSWKDESGSSSPGTASAVVGFRLAMDYIGPLHCSCKRKKAR